MHLVRILWTVGTGRTGLGVTSLVLSPSDPGVTEQFGTDPTLVQTHVLQVLGQHVTRHLMRGLTPEAAHCTDGHHGTGVGTSLLSLILVSYPQPLRLPNIERLCQAHVVTTVSLGNIRGGDVLGGGISGGFVTFLMGLKSWPISQKDPTILDRTSVQIDVIMLGQDVMLEVAFPFSFEVTQLTLIHPGLLIEHHVSAFDRFCLLCRDFLSFELVHFQS